jgi:ferredoxin
MKTDRILVCFFSPTGGTEKVARLLGAELEKTLKVEYLDMTVPDGKTCAFGAAEAAVFCVPVYGGRVPSPVAERLSRMSGNDTPAALAAVFGNRAVDDALLELKNMAAPRGFRTICAGEFVAPHSVNPAFGAGRPDGEDMKVIAEMASAFAEKLKGAESAAAIPQISVPGNPEYRAYDGIPLKPAAGKKCVKCGACAANCPAGAISKDNPAATDREKCISCMRCIRVCPRKARNTPAVMRLVSSVLLGKYCRGRKDDKIYT